MSDRDPDLTLGPISLWLVKSRYASGHDAYSMALLDFELAVETSWSSVRASGEISAGDVAVFHAELTEIQSKLEGEARLESMHSATLLSLTIKMTGLGRAEAIIEVRLPMDEERHRIFWETDQTYLEPLLRQTRALTAAYPSPFKAQPRPRPTERSETSAAPMAPSGFWSNLADVVFGKRDDPG